MSKKLFMCTLLVFMIAAVSSAAELSLSDVNNFLNTSAKIGEGTKANQVAVIPFNHIDGPKEEDLFYAFVPFKYVARNYVKYQITFLACTCRPADLNVWSTAYVELTLPSSGKIDDAEVKFLSYDSDSTGHYLGGFWGDSNPSPIAPTAKFEKFKAEMFPYFIGKKYSELKGYNEISGFKDFNADAWTGATVSSNNNLRAIQALFAYHATDSFFDGDPAALELRSRAKRKPQQQSPVQQVPLKKQRNSLLLLTPPRNTRPTRTTLKTPSAHPATSARHVQQSTTRTYASILAGAMSCTLIFGTMRTTPKSTCGILSAYPTLHYSSTQTHTKIHHCLSSTAGQPITLYLSTKSPTKY